MNRSTFINTHNLSEAERICDTVALVKNRVVRIGNPKELARGLFARTVSFTLDHVPATLLQEISSLEIASEARISSSQLIVNVRRPEEDNPRIITWLVNHKVSVQFVTEEEHSLEDVYLKLIEGGGQ
jgi:ABC-2 type transport system ATP-binding protein